MLSLFIVLRITLPGRAFMNNLLKNIFKKTKEAWRHLILSFLLLILEIVSNFQTLLFLCKLVYSGEIDAISMYSDAELFLKSSDGFFLWRVSYLLPIVITSCTSWFRVGVCLKHGHFFFSMYDISTTIIIKEMLVVAAKTDTMSKVAEMKYV